MSHSCGLSFTRLSLPFRPVLLATTMLVGAPALLHDVALAQSFGGKGGSAGGGAGGGYQQAGTNGSPGDNGGGGGGPGSVPTAGGLPGSANAGGGGIGGVNGATTAIVPGGSVTGGNGGNATPAANPTTTAGGGGGSGGYGLVLTTAGPFTDAAGQVFTGGIGGAGNGTVSGGGGYGGGGGGGILLQSGGTFTNVQGASAIGGMGGATPSVAQDCQTNCGGKGGDGLTTSNYIGPTFAATVTNAGSLTGGAGGSQVDAPGTTAAQSTTTGSVGGSGVAFLGGGSLTNTSTGKIAGGVGGAGFQGTATQTGGRGGNGGTGVLQTGGGTIINSGQISGGDGAAGAIGTPALIRAVTGGIGGTGISLTGIAGSIVNNGTITGGKGGNGGNGTLGSPASPGQGGVGGTGVAITAGSLLNFGQITGGAAGKGADATLSGQVGSGRQIISGGNGVNLSGSATLDNRGTITGGRGADAGASGANAAGSNGGNGGVGVSVTGSAGAGELVVSSGSIQGGNGGAAAPGNGGAGNGLNGDGGIGLLFRGDGTITVAGTVSGGLSGNGVTRASAINLGGLSTQTVVLKTGAAFVGNVLVDPNVSSISSFNHYLQLDGGSTGTIALGQFQNFNRLTQSGGSGGVWTVTGTGSFNPGSSSPAAPSGVSAGTMILDPASSLSLTSGSFNISTGGTLSVSTASSLQNLSILLAGGTLQITGTTLTSANFGFQGGAFDIVSAANTFTISQNLTDPAPSGLTKLGAGTLVLSGANTYTGPTTVNGGTLSVNGSIASSSLTTVNAGGTLGGTGTVGNTTINGGTLSPGNSIGTLTVQGNLVFTAAASYMVEVSPASSDRTNVTGTATLGGATVNASFAAGTYVEKQYTIVNATGGVVGTFNTLANTNLPSGFKSSLSYNANNAFLNLALDFTPTPTPTPNSGLSVNQTNVANALTGFFNRTGGIPVIFGALTPAGLTQISGEIATGSQQTTFDAMGLFLGLLTDPFIAGRGDPVIAGAGATQFADENDTASAYAANGKPRSKSERDAYAAIYRKAPIAADPFVQRWSVWAAGYGGSQTTDGNAAAGSNTATSRIAGIAVGADYRLSPNTIAGFALAGGGTNFSVANGGTGRSDLFQAGGFIRHNIGPAYITGALAYGWQDVTTDRTVAIAGLDLLRARFNANAYSGRVEGGYRFVTPWMNVGLTPYAAGQFTTFELPAYAEGVVAGANTFALSYAAKDVTASRSELGLRSDKSFAMPNGIFTLRGRAAWAHDFNPDRSVLATFQTLPGASFVVNGAAQARDAALVTGAAEMKWRNGFSLAATFEGEFSDVTRSYAGKGVARYAW